MKRRIEITVEHERTIRLGTGPATCLCWCEGCQDTVQFALVSHAALVSNISIRSICRLVEQGHLHFVERERDLFVCLPSLGLVDPQNLESESPTNE
jgi:hypothetical protein